ncbi:MAG TPA: PH domain-containing protein [Arenimonas sp.]|nr:PH domain-containing protein [Arenimonas sp.]
MTDEATPLPFQAWPPKGWQPLPDGARTVSGITGALTALPIMVGLAAAVVLANVDGWGPRIGIGLALLALGGLAGWSLGRARWRRTRWMLDERGLSVQRGLVWRSEVLVPRTRVQHLDLERGPIERRFGLATLVVHTAGTRMNALRQHGFLDADAVALRDALLPESNRHDDAL